MIEDEPTMPLSTIFPQMQRARDSRPTLRQIRERCGLSYFQVAQAAGVRLCIVYWMEQGIAVHGAEAMAILSVLSHSSGWLWTLHNLKGIRLKRSVLQRQISQCQSHVPVHRK